MGSIEKVVRISVDAPSECEVGMRLESWLGNVALDGGVYKPRKTTLLGRPIRGRLGERERKSSGVTVRGPRGWQTSTVAHLTRGSRCSGVTPTAASFEGMPISWLSLRSQAIKVVALGLSSPAAWAMRAKRSGTAGALNSMHGAIMRAFASPWCISQTVERA